MMMISSYYKKYQLIPCLDSKSTGTTNLFLFLYVLHLVILEVTYAHYKNVRERKEERKKEGRKEPHYISSVPLRR